MTFAVMQFWFAILSVYKVKLAHILTEIATEVMISTSKGKVVPVL
jgi:hypothetical protein